MNILGAKIVREIVSLPKEVTVEEARALLIHHLSGGVFTVGKLKKPAVLSQKVVEYLNEVASPLPRSRAFLERYFVLDPTYSESIDKTVFHVLSILSDVVVPKHILEKLGEPSAMFYFTDEGSPVFWGEGLQHYISLKGSV